MKPAYLKYSILLLLTWVCTYSFSQTIYYNTSHEGLYHYLDEMANDGLIELNSVVKPYSRAFIASKLKEIFEQQDKLNKRQKSELDFFLRDFNKELMPNKNFKKRIDLFYYKDSLFTFSVNPILGSYFFSNKTTNMYQRWVGAEAFATVDNHWGFYANLRDYVENEAFSSPMYLENRQGFVYKNTTDYSEMRGGVTYTWKWGNIGFVKDQFVWGNNYNGANIFSGNIPTVPQLRMKLNPVKWFEFNYIHAWLVSEVADSSRTYRSFSGNIYPMHPKFLTANMFTFRPVKKTSLSFGNSIIYADYDYPGYMIPTLFYKSVAHTNRNGAGGNETVNAQLFFDFSTRIINHLHLYTTFYIDELSFSRMFDKDKQSNYFSYKGGVAVENLPVKNVKFIFEYTRTNPLTFQHNIVTTTFASNSYNLGHYLRDNAEEFFASVIVKPWSTLRLQGKFIYARKGKEYAGNRAGEEWGQPFIASTDWKNRSVGLSANYQIMNDLYVSLECMNSIFAGNSAYTASQFWGHQSTWILGLIYGF